MLSQTDNPHSSPASTVPFAIERQALNPRTSVISVEGDLDLASAPRLKWMLVDALGEGHSQLILDLSQATFMDSTALAVIVTEHKRLRHSDGTLTIISPPSSVRRLFEITGLTTVLDIVPATERR